MIINGKNLLEMEKNKILTKSENTGKWETSVGGTETGAVTFTSHGSYVGLPQLKTYYDLNIHFQLRTMDLNGLILFNSGQKADFLAVEILDGHVHLVFNIGMRRIELKDNYPSRLNNNQWHSVTITRKLINCNTI